MRKLVLALSVIAAMTSAAHAESWGHSGYGHREWHGNGGGWVAPMVGGLFVGGMLAEMQYNYQLQQQQQILMEQQYMQQQQYQQNCRQVLVGDVVIDGQKAKAYKTVCH